MTTLSVTPSHEVSAVAPTRQSSEKILPASAVTTPVPPINLLSLLTPAWLAGSLLLLVYLVLGYLGLARIRRACRQVDDPDVLAAVAEVSRSAGIPAPAIIQGSRVGNPFVAGIMCPTIYLPSGWGRVVDPDTLRAVIRHEVAHISNRDLGWNLLHRLVCIALWPQPLLWLIRRPMRAASEELCDRHVLTSGMAESRYAECLLNLREGLRGAPCPSLGIGAVSARSSVGRRVEAILDDRRSRSVKLPAWGSAFLRLGALALAGGAVLLFARPTSGSAVQDNWVVKPYAGRIEVLSPGGKPALGASAWLVYTGDLPEAKSQMLRVDGSDILLTADNVSPHVAATLVVTAKGFGVNFARLWPAPKQITQIALSAPATIAGRLLAASGRPVSGVPVEVKLLVRGVPGNPEFLVADAIPNFNLRATSAADGTFRIEGLSPHTQVAYDVDDDRYAQLRMSDRVETGDPGLTRAKDAVLHAAGRISGRVTRDGEPFAGVRIGAQSNHEKDSNPDFWSAGVSGPDGRFTLDRMHSGVYNVATDLRNGLDRDVTAVAHEAVTVKEGETVSNLDFKLVPGVIIEGRVTDEAGKPVGEASVGVYGPAHPNSSAWVQVTLTDRDGRYRLRVPAGRQRLYMADSRYHATEQIVDISDGTSARLDFQVSRQEEDRVGEVQPEVVSSERPKEEDTGPVPPVASFGPGGPFYGPAKLANGATVRLAFIQDDAKAPHTLWRPDGSPPDRSDVARSLDMSGFVSRRDNPRVLCARVEVNGVQRGDYDCVLQVAHRCSRTVWQSYGDGGGRTMDLASFRAPESLKVTDMRFGVAAGKFRVLQSGKLGEGPLFAHASSGKVTPDEQIGASIKVRVPDGLEGKDVRLAAYDRSGKSMELSSWEPETLVERSGVKTRAHGFKGALAQDVVRVELIARDYQWVTFKGIHVYPFEALAG